MLDRPTTLEVARLYGLDPLQVRPDLEIAGSPERCIERAMVEDKSGDLVVVERLHLDSRARKVQIADTLAILGREGLHAIHPYVTNVRGEQIEAYGGAFWQIMPFVKGVPLPRPAWATESWRGEALASFLIALNRISTRLTLGKEWPVFSLQEYVRELVETISIHKPSLLPDLKPVVAHLEGSLFSMEEQLPKAFCHGDYHPINVIWANDRMLSVIDWEFMGPKLEMYDVANLVGCVGIEAPSALVGPLVSALLGKLAAARLYAVESWRLLPETVLANRFGWLSEWLRKQDQEMVELELDHMHLLMERGEALRSAWATLA